MKIQINTDANIQTTEALADQVSASIEQALQLFKEHITRVEVHLSDESRGKIGPHDQRCMLEARLEGRKPVAVTDHATTLEEAVDGAAVKLTHLLESTLGRLHDRREKPSAVSLSEAEPE
ncbi:MAG: ribosomal subunit interface protein [Arenicella sp.]|jgi:ribosomal subunit interface protein